VFPLHHTRCRIVLGNEVKRITSLARTLPRPGGLSASVKGRMCVLMDFTQKQNRATYFLGSGRQPIAFLSDINESTKTDVERTTGCRDRPAFSWFVLPMRHFNKFYQRNIAELHTVSETLASVACVQVIVRFWIFLRGTCRCISSSIVKIVVSPTDHAQKTCSRCEY